MREPGARAGIETYCRTQGILGASANSDDLEVSDIRIARLPDTDQGPGLMAHFRRHAEVPLGETRQQPDLLLVMGGWNDGCEIVVTQATCPQAEAIYASLASASIPVGYAFDDPAGAEVMHGTVYFLSSRDGHGNLIEWSYYGPGHPLQEQIHRALDDLEVCAEPAAPAFRALSPP